MPKFSLTSKSRLETAHVDLQVLFNHVVKSFDCSILQGHRSEDEQNKAYDEGRSKKRFPESKHNCFPSMAVDVVPYPLPAWRNKADFAFFGGYVLGIAQMLLEQGIITHKVRYGGDFNSNQRVDDGWFDGVHFELIENK